MTKEIDFYEILGDEDSFYWAHSMHDELGYGRYSLWNRPTPSNFPRGRWDNEARRLYYKISAKYDGQHATCGPAIHMRNRCIRARRNYEKLAYYYGDGHANI